MPPYRKGVTVTSVEGVDVLPRYQASTTSVGGEGRIKRPRPQGQRAAPLKATRRAGKRTPVTVSLKLAGGGGGWVVVTAPQGRFMLPLDATVWSLIEKVQTGAFRPL